MNLELWVPVDENGDYVVRKDRDDLADAYDEEIGDDNASGRRAIKVVVNAPLPKPIEAMNVDELRKAHPGMILLFRVGDFYEAYGDDAVKVAKVLKSTITSRGELKMCGFPHSVLEMYLHKLFAAKCRVAICDEVRQ